MGAPSYGVCAGFIDPADGRSLSLAWAEDGVSFATPTSYGFPMGSIPALANISGMLVAYRAEDSGHALTVVPSADGSTFYRDPQAFPTVPIGDTPALANFAQQVRVAYRADDASNALCIASTTDGRNFTIQRYGNIAMTTNPGMAVYQGQLFVGYRAVKDANNWLSFVSSSDGTTFSQPVTGKFALGGSPALAAFQNLLVAAFQAPTSFWLSIAVSVDGKSFGAPVSFANCQAAFAPAMTVFEDKLVIAYQDGTTNQLCAISTTDGVTFTQPKPSGIVMSGGPGLCQIPSL
jgi:hypothetical protein